MPPSHTPNPQESVREQCETSTRRSGPRDRMRAAAPLRALLRSRRRPGPHQPPKAPPCPASCAALRMLRLSLASELLLAQQLVNDGTKDGDHHSGRQPGVVVRVDAQHQLQEEGAPRAQQEFLSCAAMQNSRPCAAAERCPGSALAPPRRPRQRAYAHTPCPAGSRRGPPQKKIMRKVGAATHVAATLVIVLRVGRDGGVALQAVALGQPELGRHVAAVGGVAPLPRRRAAHQDLRGWAKRVAVVDARWITQGLHQGDPACLENSTKGRSQGRSKQPGGPSRPPSAPTHLPACSRQSWA